MSKSRITSKFIFTLLFLSIVTGCFRDADRAPQAEQQVPSDELSRRLLRPDILTDTGLEILWQNKLPIGKSETLKQLFVLGDGIYALSDRNYMIALDRQKGSIIFSRSIAPVSFVVLGLELYEDQLISIIGNKLVEINPQSGTQQSVLPLEIGPTCPAVRNSSFFYIAGVDGRICALRASDRVKIFEVAAENDSMITSIVADETAVIFATDTGRCISITSDGPKKLWQFDAADAVVGQIVKDAESLFFASKDTNVYKLNALTGRLVWKHQTPTILDRGPRVSETVVYQRLRNRGLAAIDKETGDTLWHLAEGLDLLAEADGKAYVITKTGNLIIMDNKKAKQLYSVSLPAVSKYTTNLADSKIYIADDAGRVACLKPVE